MTMYAKRIIVLATLLTLASAQTVRADFIYQFTTTESAGPGGILSFTITASDAAVATGALTAFNITSLDLHLTATSNPFLDVNTSDPVSLQGQGFQVNPTTGAYVTDPSFGLLLGDPFLPTFELIQTRMDG
jgi:hypothetical protein